MTALHTLRGSGGWPLNVWVTPDRQPFYGATYIPREEFLQLLDNVRRAWRDNRPAVEDLAGRVAAGVRRATASAETAGEVNDDAVQQALAALLRSHDAEKGGFGRAPKFPSEARYLFLLDEALRGADPVLIDLLRFDLEAMARGGIYDQIGGGFHRYSTDADWLVPHFEKMLYNQALLARVYAKGWQLTGEPDFARTARQTLDYVLRDMRAPGGGFYSATDADSEGHEGLFFLWTAQQIRRALPAEDAELAIRIFGVTDAGNFEATNILHLPQPLSVLARGADSPRSEFLARVDAIRSSLYESREGRVHPLRDEKIVTAWNGMMIGALAQSARILHEPRYRAAAVKAAEFLWRSARRKDERLWRVHHRGRSSVAGAQEDYAWFADACLHLYDLTGEERWLRQAETLAATMDRLFWDDDDGAYFMGVASPEVAPMARAAEEQGAVSAALGRRRLPELSSDSSQDRL